MVVAAAKADRELDAQTEAFDKLRDLVINAPSRLDTLTQQMVDLTARLSPSEQALATLHNQFDAAALTSVAENVETAKQRLEFADQNITTARALVARPVGQQMGLVDAVRAAESSLGQARSLLDAVDTAGADINRAVAALPAAITDIKNGINQANGQLQQGPSTHQSELSAARDQAAAAVADAEKNGSTDPLGAFTRLTKADADLDRLLASVAEERQAAERLNRAFDQALFSAQSRVRGVSDFIDTRRGSIGPEARTRLAEAVRQLQAAQDKRATNLNEAIAHANGAAMLAGQAQSLASDDVQAAQRTYTSGWGGGGSGSDMGGVIGGIIIGNILSGAYAWRVRRRLRRRPRHGPDDVLRRVVAFVGTQLQRWRRPLLVPLYFLAHRRACVSEGDTPHKFTSFRTLTRRATAQLDFDATQHVPGSPPDVVEDDRHYSPTDLLESSPLLAVSAKHLRVAVPIEPVILHGDLLSGQAKSTRHTGHCGRRSRTAARRRQSAVDHHQPRFAFHRRFGFRAASGISSRTITIPRLPACRAAAARNCRESQVPLRSAASSVARARGRRRLRATSTAVQGGVVAGRPLISVIGAPPRRCTKRPSLLAQLMAGRIENVKLDDIFDVESVCGCRRAETNRDWLPRPQIHAP